MSKIGNKPVVVPSGVTVTVTGSDILVQGPKGKHTVILSQGLTIKNEQDSIVLSRKNDDKALRGVHGLMRMLIANAVKGVTDGWEKVLEIQGTGFRVATEGTKLAMKLGFSHTAYYDVPSDVQIEVKGLKMHVRGVDKQRVGEVAAQIKRFKKPDKYKGKGIRYEGEVVRLKPGKKAKAGA
ncbi:MAG: 50S ribosomal protein L6 [Patescibacteria group bacterium]